LESSTETINLYAAWFGILAGFVAGAIQGLFFHDDNWLGGYTSWTRRMTRLGHIAFFGIGFVNLAYALTVRTLELEQLSPWPSWLFVVGAIGMPLVCYASAFWKPLRHFFFIPVLCLLVGAVIFIFGDLLP
jgi:hypothetical protein